MFNLYIHIIYITIILSKIKLFRNKKEVKENINPTIEYYNWKRLFFKIMVLHELNIMCKAKLHHKHHTYSKNRRKLRKNNLTTMSAFFNFINLSKFVYNIQDFS